MAVMLRYASLLLFILTLPMTAPLASRAQQASHVLTPAAAATPIVASSAITTETLAEITFPAASLPPSPAIVDVWLATLRPGEELGFETGASPPSIVADVILSGELKVLSEGRLQVQRATGREDVPANTVVTIHPEETVIYVDNQAAQTFRNTSTEMLTALSFGVFSAAPPSTFTEGEVSQEDWQRSGLAGHDLTVTVDRLTLPPRVSLPAFTPDIHSPRIFVVAEGAAQWAIIAPGRATPTASYPLGRGETLGFRTPATGEQLQVRNDEEQPLVLLQVTLGTEHPATPAPAPHRLAKWPVSTPATTPGE
jgi:mannose-6-phosphate isomerase-like protein (cupin superfamily)